MTTPEALPPTNSHRRTRRRLLGAMVAGALARQAAAQTQNDETAPIRWIVPFPPGGGTDVATRLVARRFGEVIHRSVIVENRPGAATSIAASEMARAKPDGNNILTAGMSTLTLNPALYPKLPYRPESDFAMVSTLVSLPMVLVVNPKVPAKTLPELLAWLRTRQSSASYASTGVGTPHHVVAALWLESYKLETVHVPYKSMPNALQDLAGGQFEFMFGDLATAAPLIASGALTAIAVPSRTRSATLPQVPTFAEAGAPFEAAAWQGVVMPAGTSRETVERYSKELRAVLRDPSVADALRRLGMEPTGSTPDEFARYVTAERARWGSLIREKGIHGD